MDAELETDELRLEWGGTERRALAVFPSHPDPDPDPVQDPDPDSDPDRDPNPRPDLDLLLVFHGSAQTGRAIRRMAPGFDVAAAAGRAVVLYPDGVSHHWNDARVDLPFATRHRGTDDVGFVRDLVEEARRRWSIRRTVAAGFSNGGEFVIRLALEMPDELAAIATIAAPVPAPGNLAPTVTRPGSIPAILFHGTADPITPYDGGVASIHGARPRGEHLSAPESAAFWAQRNGISASPETTAVPDAADEHTTVERTVYTEVGRDPVELWTVVGGGHTVPGGRHPGPLWGPTASRLDAAAEILRFSGLVPDFDSCHRGGKTPP